MNLFITVLETADLSVIAADDVNLPSLHRIITSAPNSLVEAASPEWQEGSDCYGLI